MAIEDDEKVDRDVGKRVARHEYAKASDSAPGTVHLYHLVILASIPIINLTATRHKFVLPKDLLRPNPCDWSTFCGAAPRNSVTKDSICMFMSNE